MNPKPKVFDGVERIDGKRLFGTISEIIDYNRVIVVWGYGDIESEEIEYIDNLKVIRKYK
jgi:hypothetical protein